MQSFNNEWTNMQVNPMKFDLKNVRLVTFLFVDATRNQGGNAGMEHIFYRNLFKHWD